MKSSNNKLTIQYLLTSLLVFIGLTLCNASTAAEAETSDIHLSITTHLGDDQHFQVGDEISLLLNLSQDAYLLLVYQDANGNLVKLFPVRRNDNGWVRAGDFMPFPRRADGLRLIVGPPFGEEQVWAFASTENFSGEPLKNIVSIEKLRRQLRSADIAFSSAFTQLTTHTDQR